MGNVNDHGYHSCKAYDEFRKEFNDIRSKYTHINPEDGKLFDQVKRGFGEEDKALDDTGMEIVRNGMKAMMPVWERFVTKMFKEAFRLVVDLLSTEARKSSLGLLQRRWPLCRTIIQEEIKKQAAEKTGGKVEVLTYEIYQEADADDKNLPWKKLLNDYCDRVLREKPLLPIFGCQGTDRDDVVSIDDLFQQLFQEVRQENEGKQDKRQGKKQETKQKGKTISEIMIETGGFTYVIRTPDNHQVTLVQDEPSNNSAVEALYNISRLYHGLRCTLTERDHEEVFTGPLKSFPDNLDHFLMPSENSDKVKEHYVNLYRRIRGENRHVKVSYLTYLNLTRFYAAAAYILMYAVAKWFYDLQTDSPGRLKIWEYDPSKVPVYSETGEN